MATTYVVLQDSGSGYSLVGEVDAANATVARRTVAESSLTSKELDEGVTLIAIPMRNWRAGIGRMKAETTRRIRSS